MPGAQSLLKRGTPSLFPHEIKVIVDPKHPLYDERLELPVPDSAIRNFAVRGQVQPVAVRVDGDDVVLVEGRQRWKRASVINHIAGVHPYKGKIEALREAIARLEGTELAQVIADRCPNGMKLRFDVYRGDERSAAAASVAANEHREDDPVEAKIRKAQRLAGQGFEPGDILIEFGGKVTLATVKRWLAADLSKPKVRRERTKVIKPGPKKLALLRDHLDAANLWAISAAVKYALGEMSAKELGEKVPELTGKLG